MSIGAGRPEIICNGYMPESKDYVTRQAEIYN